MRVRRFRPVRRGLWLRAHRPTALRAAVAVALAAVLGANAAAAGAAAVDIAPAPAPPPAPAPLPTQRLGTATDFSHVSRPGLNRTVPQSWRGRYPLPRAKAPVWNRAAVTPAPAPAPRAFDAGFAEATSPEVPELRDRYRRVYANPDGSQTTMLSTSPLHTRQADGRWVPVPAGPPVDTHRAGRTMYVTSAGQSTSGEKFYAGRDDAGRAAAGYLAFADDDLRRLRGHLVLGAALAVVQFDAHTCRPKPVAVHPVTEAWDRGRTFPGPAVGARLASRSFNHGHIGHGQSQSACPAASERFDLGAAGAALVRAWADGRKPNHGLSLRAADSAEAMKAFATTATRNPPALYVTHSPYNAGYEIPDPVPNPAVQQNQPGRVKVTVTNTGAEDWKANDFYLGYRVYDARTGKAVAERVQRAAELASTVRPGQRASVEATVQPLRPGAYLIDFSMVDGRRGAVFTDHQVPPGRLTLYVFDKPAEVLRLFPANGHQAPTLTPLLSVFATDPDAPADSALQYRFELCEGETPTSVKDCVTRDFSPLAQWQVPEGRLYWGRSYQWRAFVRDTGSTIEKPFTSLLPSPPQPSVTSGIASAPHAAKDRDFDPQLGNVTMTALDAPVVVTGPDLNISRTYNSLDPRTDSMFGAGWINRYDMRVTRDGDNSGNVVITYPDGQTVRFGRNPNGTYAPPAGRAGSLTVDQGEWLLRDRSGVRYRFDGASGRLVKIVDHDGRAQLATWDGPRLARVQQAPSSGHREDRALHLTWDRGHVVRVSTDPVNGAPLTWEYRYAGDLLTRVCGPLGRCTGYDYADGSHYRSSVLDARPESYWRFGDHAAPAHPGGGPAGRPGAASEIAVNQGRDAGVATDVEFGAEGAVAGTANRAARFNGRTSAVALPRSSLRQSRDAAVELWFRQGPQDVGGPLVGYQDQPLDKAPTYGVPLLYTDPNGFLRGQFGTGRGGELPGDVKLRSRLPVNDGRWHHAVLSAAGNAQSLLVDGEEHAKVAGPALDNSTLDFAQIGAAHVTGTWTGLPAGRRHYAGTVDEVALYLRPVTAETAAAHHRLGRQAAKVLSKLTLPSGKVAAEAEYDVDLDRVREYTDSDGGTWRIGAPAVFGNESDLRRSVVVRDPRNKPYLYEYDAIANRVLRLGMPVGLEGVPQETETDPDDQPAPTRPVDECKPPKPDEPVFCSVLPDSAGTPVFVQWDLKLMGVRTFEYDAQGRQRRIVNEYAAALTMEYDARGNLTKKTTCRAPGQCQSVYSTYRSRDQLGGDGDLADDLATEVRDARSSGPDDARYVTRTRYDTAGRLVEQQTPMRATVSHEYYRAESNVDPYPSGLLVRSTDAKRRSTLFGHNRSGDVTTVTMPHLAGAAVKPQTVSTYDALGRRLTETLRTQEYPDGVTTSFTYDEYSRPATVTGPVTTDAVTGTKHQRRTVNEYDDDGNLTRSTVSDALTDAPARVTVVEYDAFNRPVATLDPEGNETSREYDVFGNVTVETDANGTRTEYLYTAQNKRAEVRLRDPRNMDVRPCRDRDKGRRYLTLHVYSYDWAGRLASDTDALCRRLEYEYHSDDLLKRIVLKNADGAGRDVVVEQTEYDNAGNVTLQKAANGRRTTYTETDADGRTTRTAEDPDNIARSTLYTFDAMGNPETVRVKGRSSHLSDDGAFDDWGEQSVVAYDYDALGNLTAERAVDGERQRTTTYTHDQRGLVTSSTEPRGNAPGADRAAFTTTFGYDELGRRVRATGPQVAAESGGGSPAAGRATTVTGYDAFGEVVAVRDPLGNVTRTAYDRLGRPVRTTAPTYTAPGGPHEAVTPTTSTRYDGNGNVVESTDARGRVSRFGYDQFNRIVTRELPGGDDGAWAVWRYAYTATGEVSEVTDPRGGVTRSTYDDQDRLVTVTVVERHPHLQHLTTRSAYDEVGNLLTTETPSGAVTANRYDSAGQLVATTTPNGVTTKFGYDQYGRQVRVSDGAGRTVRSQFDRLGNQTGESAHADARENAPKLRAVSNQYDEAGHLVRSVDPYGKATTFAYDAAGRMTTQVEPVGDGRTITTGFGYDLAGNRTRYTDGRGHDTVYTVNTLGLPESVVEPRTARHPEPADRTWTVAYDPGGLPTRLAAPGGVTRSRTYDNAGRLRTESGAGAEAATATRELGYDLAGRLTTVRAPRGDNSFRYDDRGALMASTGPSGDATFDYDEDGRLRQRSDAAGTATFTYDKARLATATDGMTRLTQRLGYDAAGNVDAVDYGAGRVRTLTYDTFGRLAGDTLRNAEGGVVASLAYGFDLNGHLTSKKAVGFPEGGDNTYDYDDAGRLTRWTGPGGATAYGWDDAGNRTRAGAHTATYDERNRLLADGEYTYDHTARGTMAARTSSGLKEPLAFDAFDRLVSAHGQSYTYDGLDRVAGRNDSPFRYAGDDNDVVTDGGDTFSRGPTGELLATAANGGAPRLALTDGHGDVVGDLDPTADKPAALSAATTYDPWGQVVGAKGDTGNLGFQGDWTDPATRQVNMGARWYQPGTGGFASRDSATYAAGDSILANRYTYAAGAPLDFDDPDGHWPKWLDRGVNAVSHTISAAGRAVSGAYQAASHYASRAWEYAKSAVRTAVSWVGKAASWVYGKAKAGWSWVADKARQGWNAITSGKAWDWARQKARELAARAYEQARQVTARAKAAVVDVVRNKVLPVVKALTKPLLTGIKTVVSASAKFAANVVGTVRASVNDPAKFLQGMYQAAADRVGALIEQASTLAHAAGEWVEAHKADIIGFAAGAVVGLGCGALIGWTGVGAVACGALAGAVGSAVTGAMEGKRGAELWKGIGTGALFGGLAGGLGSAVGAGLKAGFAAVGGGLRTAAGAAGRGISQEFSALARGRVSGGLLGRCPNSFTPETRVLMGDGSTKPIAQVKVGDKVLATDPTTAVTAVQAVTAVVAGSGDKALVEVTVRARDGVGASANVTATAGHPFWIPSLRAWVQAKDIKPGYTFLTADRRTVEVVEVRNRYSQTAAFNLSVGRLHTYYVAVGESAVLAHNCKAYTGSHRQNGDSYVGEHRAYEYRAYHGRHHVDGPPDYVGAHRPDTWWDKVGAKFGPQVYEAGHEGWQTGAWVSEIVGTVAPEYGPAARVFGTVAGGSKGWLQGGRDGVDPWRIPHYSRPNDFN
ncbi:hypothetical protein GCM10010124_36450 [Pilimelia terevasa]|uniref:Hint domain-containing protein n=1 Tax=Pilimelia terevasa TaxID=53372 RepID=A0A8J3FLB1_9ACTN|nr:polymorphic toxin-type HINT domain-containing protein [Pilimelia terevasa]GGK40396.1 hypothetical protein GCM10010124_36450 [Pilimelia terevasa]